MMAEREVRGERLSTGRRLWDERLWSCEYGREGVCDELMELAANGHGWTGMSTSGRGMYMSRRGTSPCTRIAAREGMGTSAHA